jgi:hypothetical protein
MCALHRQNISGRLIPAPHTAEAKQKERAIPQEHIMVDNHGPLVEKSAELYRYYTGIITSP